MICPSVWNPASCPEHLLYFCTVVPRIIKLYFVSVYNVMGPQSIAVGMLQLLTLKLYSRGHSLHRGIPLKCTVIHTGSSFGSASNLTNMDAPLRLAMCHMSNLGNWNFVPWLCFSLLIFPMIVKVTVVFCSHIEYPDVSQSFCFW